MRTPALSISALAATALTACGGGGQERTEEGTASAPTVTLDASQTSIASGSTVGLTWSSTNATGCSAEGGWSGSRAVSGSETSPALTADTTFTLRCEGSGGSASRSVTVTVTVTPPTGGGPTLSFSANPTSVASGGSSTLTWSTTSATTCTASGGWSGSRATSGSTAVGPLASTQSFTLQCTGNGGSVTRSVAVTVSSGSSAALSGRVDSSLVDAVGTNRVYVWAGDVTPIDLRGVTTDPVAVIAVEQDPNACTFSYASSGALPAGTYTVAFTDDAAADAPGTSDSLTFRGRAVVSIGSSPVTRDFAAANVLRVGATRPYQNVRAAAMAAGDGDVIEIDAGTYQDDVVVLRQNRLVLRGVGGRAHVQGTRVIPFVSGDDENNGKGLWVVRGTGIRVENVEFSGARVTDENGAGIRGEGRDLTVCGCSFHDNENGILGGAYGSFTVEYSEFADNGIGEFGRTHNIYVDDGGAVGDRLVFRHNYTHHAHIGHTLKSRARENFILYNRIMTEADGTSSYEVDLPNGGLTYLVGNLIQQGADTDNAIMVAYGAEGLSGGWVHELYVVNNTLVNDRGSGTFLDVASGTAVLRTVNNLFVGSGTLVSGKTAQATTNLHTTAPGLVDLDGFDYRLTTGSPARDAGSAPGFARGVNLAPVYQYVHPAHRTFRTANGNIDIGAYEFTP